MNSRPTSGNAFLRIWSAHGDQIRWIAETILGNRAVAQVVVVDVITTRCRRPLAAGELPSRHELARMTYLRCLRAGAQHERAAVALVELGDHSTDDVADLLGLSTETVAQLLVAGRRAVEPAPAPGREPGPGLVELIALLAHE